MIDSSMNYNRNEQFEIWRAKQRRCNKIISQFKKSIYLPWEDLDSFSIKLRYNMFKKQYATHTMTYKLASLFIKKSVFITEQTDKDIYEQAKQVYKFFIEKRLRPININDIQTT